MNRIKTLSLPLITALVAATAVSASGQLVLEASSEKTYRQNQKSINFQGGKFNVDLTDGNIIYIAGCIFFRYIPPGFYENACAPGTNGRVVAGNLGGLAKGSPYLLVSSISPAVVVEPRQSKLIALTSAPASGLARPQGGFSDNSVSLYYNLQALDQKEYVITRYEFSKSYNKSQRSKFDSDIVPGTYRYSFPRLRRPTVPAPITAQIYAMPEGLNKRNNVTSGFEFTAVNKDVWTKDGFVELSYINPNIIKWRQLSASSVFQSADSLSFSIRVMIDPKNPNSSLDLIDRYSKDPQSIFPDYSSGADPKLVLNNPFVTSTTIPPIFDGGTRGMIEVQLQRAFSPGGVSYDFSTRKFQIPIVVVNRYSEYQESVFSKKSSNQTILADGDGDGINNLNEWILDSNAADSQDFPLQPVPAPVLFATDRDYFDFTDYFSFTNYFGFIVKKKLGTVPAVVHTLQRSKDGGKTWDNFVSGYYFADGTYSKTFDVNGNDPKEVNWIVKTLKYAPGVGLLKENSPQREEIQVVSGYRSLTNRLEGARPPGTENETFRVKVTLKK